MYASNIWHSVSFISKTVNGSVCVCVEILNINIGENVFDAINKFVSIEL